MIPVPEPAPVVRLWSLETGAVPDPLPSEFRRCLDDRERERAARFARACDRRTFICAHALRRALLARTCGLPAGAWRFTGQPLEKPRIDRRIAPFLAHHRLDCNLTHTDGLVAAVVADGAMVGVDAEVLGE
ncbi:hypothetical protein, partial [Rhodospirillum rubrum]|uniref:hypothetical protein n=1 Tax=Rhodospirillum rubrum TaxID=1085 RepID=UPI0035589B7F